MPHYSFKCEKCEIIETAYFSFFDEHKLFCLVCEQNMRKIIHATPTIFMGDGWAGKRV